MEVIKVLKIPQLTITITPEIQVEFLLVICFMTFFEHCSSSLLSKRKVCPFVSHVVRKKQGLKSRTRWKFLSKVLIIVSLCNDFVEWRKEKGEVDRLTFERMMNPFFFEYKMRGSQGNPFASFVVVGEKMTWTLFSFMLSLFLSVWITQITRQRKFSGILLDSFSSFVVVTTFLFFLTPLMPFLPPSHFKLWERKVRDAK